MTIAERVIKTKMRFGTGKAAGQCIESLPSDGIEISRSKPNLRNRIGEEIEKAVVELAIEEPAWGQVRAANQLKKRGVTVWRPEYVVFWLRHDLETMKKRLKALETKSLQEGLVLTEGQVAALEKAKQDKEARGIRERVSRVLWGAGYFLCRDAHGVGRIYQQMLIYTCSKVSFASSMIARLQ